MSARRSRRERVWDIAALVLVIIGLALYFWVHQALGTIGEDTAVVSGPPGSAVAAVDRLRLTGNVAIAIIVAGVLLGLWSYFRHGRGRTAAPQ